MTNNQIDELIGTLRTADWQAQSQAADALAEIGAEAVAPLIALMREYRTVADYEVNVNPHLLAVKALVKIGEPAVVPLIEALKDDAWGARAGAIYCLTQIGDVRMVQPLIEALHFEDVGSWEVYQALQRIGAEVVRPLIFALKNNASAEVRSKAAAILADFRDPLVFPALLHAAEADESSHVREAALRDLPRFRDARAVEVVIAALKDSDAGLRETAVWALGELGESFFSPRLVGFLTQALVDSDWGTRQSAAEMLIRLKSDPTGAGEKLLLADLQDADTEIRLGAAWSLADLGDGRAFDPLVRLLDHADPRVSGSAALGLSALGDQRAVALLTALLKRADDVLRPYAESALRRLSETES